MAPRPCEHTRPGILHAPPCSASSCLWLCIWFVSTPSLAIPPVLMSLLGWGALGHGGVGRRLPCLSPLVLVRVGDR